MSDQEGFLLTREWRDVDDAIRLEYWLSTHAGPRRLVLDGNDAVLFVKRTDAPSVKALLADLPTVRTEQVALCDRDGNVMTAVHCGSSGSWYECRRRLEREAITACEADISPADRYLMERFVRGGVRFADASGALRMTPSDYRPRLKVASLDIETNYRTGEILCVGVSTGAEQCVFMNGDTAIGAADFIVSSTDEKAMLRQFLTWFADCDPDLVTGWNVVGFDLTTIARRCAALGVKFALGRDGREPRIRSRSPSRIFGRGIKGDSPGVLVCSD